MKIEKREVKVVKSLRNNIERIHDSKRGEEIRESIMDSLKTIDTDIKILFLCQIVQGISCICLVLK